ncbi:MAG: hypothetical protein HY869_12275 [Chloroflexi bacterium]|nr:hypothetical protein [Chloroflexota bacterium]
MNAASSIGGWLITKLADYAMNKMLEKFGLFDATCGKCNATNSSIVIPEGRTVSITCATCGHTGQVHIASLENLSIQHAGHVQVNAVQANITTTSATIDAGNANVITQSANIHINGEAHFVGSPGKPPAPSQVIDAQVVPESTLQLTDGNNLEQEITSLREKVARLEERLNGKTNPS